MAGHLRAYLIELLGKLDSRLVVKNGNYCIAPLQNAMLPPLNTRTIKRNPLKRRKPSKTLGINVRSARY